jgi:hypothetical protein
VRYRRSENDLTSAEGHTESKLYDQAIDDVHGGSLRLNEEDDPSANATNRLPAT